MKGDLRARAALAHAGLALTHIDRFEINEVLGAQVIARRRELGLVDDRLNVNGCGIAIDQPQDVTGVRRAITLARELNRTGLHYGIASACILAGRAYRPAATATQLRT